MTSELDLVQIGPDDVDPSVFTAGGVDVAELRHGLPVTRGQVDLAAFPTTGWRQVSRLEVGSGGPARFRFLAPHREDPAGWALLTFMTWTDGWLQDGDPGPLFSRPGRPSRRQFLRLRWPREPIITQIGQDPVLALYLHNVSDRPWVGNDAMETSACLLDPDGHRLPLPSVRTWQPVRKQRSIVPGGSLTITPTLVTLDVSRLPAEATTAWRRSSSTSNSNRTLARCRSSNGQPDSEQCVGRHDPLNQKRLAPAMIDRCDSRGRESLSPRARR
jgi:hypothetical protein